MDGSEGESHLRISTRSCCRVVFEILVMMAVAVRGFKICTLVAISCVNLPSRSNASATSVLAAIFFQYLPDER
jgi:hypothetical protein